MKMPGKRPKRGRMLVAGKAHISPKLISLAEKTMLLRVAEKK